MNRVGVAFLGVFLGLFLGSTGIEAASPDPSRTTVHMKLNGYKELSVWCPTSGTFTGKYDYEMTTFQLACSEGKSSRPAPKTAPDHSVAAGASMTFVLYCKGGYIDGEYSKSDDVVRFICANDPVSVTGT